jgi:SAM-dependent methyltransferase
MIVDAMNDYDRLREATKWMWALGDYGAVARHLEPHALALADACEIRTGMAVLDVAAGNGNFSIAAARRGATVTASDLTPKMIELGKARMANDGLAIEWIEADAEDLPLQPNRFDVVASVFGAMFAARPERVAAELFRVAKPGGIVAMANYSDVGFLARLSDLLREYSLTPPGGLEVPSPFEWGNPDVVRKRFGGLAATIAMESRSVCFAFGSPEEGWEFWERTNPPLMALNRMLPPDRYREVADRARRLMHESNSASDGRLGLDSGYLQVIARKAST